MQRDGCNFLEYQPIVPDTLKILGNDIERVSSYKLLGVYISNDLKWNQHVEYIVKRANKRLYALRLLKKSGLPHTDLVQIYCSLIRSVVEYASPVWAALPDYLSDLLEAVQRRALRIIFPDNSYEESLAFSALPTLSQRRDLACIRFVKDLPNTEPLRSLCMEEVILHGYNLRSGDSHRVERSRIRTDRFGAFCTNKFFPLRGNP